MNVTDRQMLVLRTVHEFLQAQGIAPTLRELGKKLGITSTNAVSDHLGTLVRRGLLQRRLNVARGLVVTNEGLELLAKDAAARAASNASAVKLVDCAEAQRIIDRYSTSPPSNDAEALVIRLALTVVARSPMQAAG